MSEANENRRFRHGLKAVFIWTALIAIFFVMPRIQNQLLAMPTGQDYPYLYWAYSAAVQMLMWLQITLIFAGWLPQDLISSGAASV
jgi:hypothetical protein